MTINTITEKLANKYIESRWGDIQVCKAGRGQPYLIQRPRRTFEQICEFSVYHRVPVKN